MAENPTYTLAQIIALAKGTTNWYEYAKSAAQHGKNNQDDISTLQSAAFSGATPGWNAAIDTRWYVADTSSSTTTYTGDTSPSATGSDALFTGFFIVFKPANNNTGASTLNVGSSDGAVNIKKISSGSKTALAADDLDSDTFAELIFDGTDWILINSPGGTALTTQGDVLYHDGTADARLAAGTSGQFLQTQGAGANPTWASADAGLSSVQVFTSSGTWSKPSGVSKVVIEVQGAGGGGSYGNDMYFGGGGAGGYAKKLLDVSSISSSTITIGTGGAGASSLGNGSVGGNSSWADGSNTITGNGGGGGLRTDDTTGGSATGGDINTEGQHGWWRYWNSTGGSSLFGVGRGRPGYGSGGKGNYNTTGEQGENGIIIVWEYK